MGGSHERIAGSRIRAVTPKNAALVGIVVVPLVAALLFHVTKWLVNGFRDEG